MRRGVQTTALLLTFGGLAGCLDDPGDEPDALDERQAPVINGTTVAVDTWGTPFLGNCSSSLMRGRWILTAKHCGVVAGSTVSINNGGTAQVIDPVFNHPF